MLCRVCLQHHYKTAIIKSQYKIVKKFDSIVYFVYNKYCNKTQQINAKYNIREETPYIRFYDPQTADKILSTL